MWTLWRQGVVCLALGWAGWPAVHGDTLRGLLREHAKAAASSRAEVSAELQGLSREQIRAHSSCQPDRASEEDRECEFLLEYESLIGQPARCTDCDQQCHIWGDPHLRPFSDSCTLLVWTESHDVFGRVFLDVPGLLITADTGQISGNTYVTAVYQNGEAMVKVDECSGTDAYDNNQGTHNHILKSDDGGDVNMMTYYGCRKNNGIWAIEIWVAATDPGLGQSSQWDSNTRSPSATSALAYWANAGGVCVDFHKYGVDPINEATTAEMLDNTDWRCNRESHLTTHDAGLDCTCSAECTAFGDPWVNDWQRKPARGTGSNGGNFQIPKVANMAPAEHIMYSFQDRMAVFIDMDDCEFIVQADIYFMKPDVLRQYRGCGTTDWFTNKSFSFDDFDIFRYRAEDMCDDTNTRYADRLRYDVPSKDPEDPSNEYLDEEMLGYNMGRHSEINGMLYPLDEVTEASKCLSSRGIDGSSNPDAEIQMGSANVVLKCHKSSRGTYYFNICIYRQKMKREMASSVSTMAEDGLTTFMNNEKYGMSSGWCSTGDYTDQQDTIISSSFERREAGEQWRGKVFWDEYDVQVAAANGEAPWEQPVVQ